MASKTNKTNTFRHSSRTKLKEPTLADKVHRATLHTVNQRNQLVDTIPEWESLRTRAREARLRALDHHDALIESFIRVMKARGINVSLAKTPDEARNTITKLVAETMDAKRGVPGPIVTKTKSMTSEEIGLNAALENVKAPVRSQAKVQVKETDLGELIVQLAHQPPSHVTAPAIHLSTEDIARIFRDNLDMEVPPWIDDPELADPASRIRLARDLSLTARQHLREHFLSADVGISGANFIVAETGTVVLLENEGNIMLTTALPKRHIVLAGIDKLIESDKDLAVLLRLLPVSATAQRQSCYVSLIADAHPDMHIVLLDHGRSKLMHDKELRDLLTCIRCGACMNICPVYRNVGGHAYGGAYPGPIGALIMPQLFGSESYEDLAFASSLCGACTETCPVKIPLHEHLLTVRTRLEEKQSSSWLSLPLRFAATAMKKGSRMSRATRLYPIMRKAASFHTVGKAWLDSRDLPPPPKESFRDWWHHEKGKLTKSENELPKKNNPPPNAITEPACAVRPEPQDLLESFQNRLVELGPEGTTELHIFEQASVAEEFLRIRCAEHPKEKIAVQGSKNAKQEYSLGVTYAALLIAETGGIVIDMRTRAEGHPIMLAETHIVVAKPSNLVPSIAHALVMRTVKRKSGAWGDYQVIVTGPSRTADVEKVLVIPAHGPKRLVVVLCEEHVKLDSVLYG